MDLWVDTRRGVAGWREQPLPLSRQEVAVLAVLAEETGRVVSRRELARRAGLTDASHRRCDALLVGLRRALGHDAVRNVRRRGWMLVPDFTVLTGGE